MAAKKKKKPLKKLAKKKVKKKPVRKKKTQSPPRSNRGEYYLIHTCDCGNDIKQLGLDVSNEIPHLHMQLLGHCEFKCDECGKQYGYGDIGYIDLDEVRI